MTFRDWQMNFQGFGDDVIVSLGVTPEELNTWKTFVRDYRRNNQRYVGHLELIQAYWVVYPDQKPLGELTVQEFKTLP